MLKNIAAALVKALKQTDKFIRAERVKIIVGIIIFNIALFIFYFIRDLEPPEAKGFSLFISMLVFVILFIIVALLIYLLDRFTKPVPLSKNINDYLIIISSAAITIVSAVSFIISGGGFMLIIVSSVSAVLCGVIFLHQ